jgi:hypothetical protein
MAYTFLVNQTPLTGSVAMYQLISTLITAGWTKVMDSDGTTYSSSGAQVTSGASGANGLGNNNAWVRLAAPAVNGGSVVNQTRELVIQRTNADTAWRIKYSASGGFGGGAPAATISPSNPTAYSYPETNQDATTSLYTGAIIGTGQSFTGTGSAISTTKWHLKKTGSPTGSAFVKIYAHSGSLGTTSIPTGTALATSNAFDVSTLSGVYALTEIKFTGANNIVLANGTDYVIAIEYSAAGSSITTSLDVGGDGSSPTATGNSSTLTGSTWTAVSTSDLCAIVYVGQQDEVLMAGAGTDAIPTGTAGWFATNNTYRWHIVAGGAAEFYSFVAWGTDSGTTSSQGNAIALDIMQTGSYPSTDPDPAVMYVSPAWNNNPFSSIMSTIFVSAWSTNPANARAWLGPTSNVGASITSGINSVNVTMISFGSFSGASAASLGTNPWTTNDDILHCVWGCLNSSIPRGVKGISTIFRAPTMVRRYMDTYNTISPGSKDIINFNQVCLPWSGATPII